MHQDLPREQFSQDIPVDVGTRLQMRAQNDQAVPVVIVASDDKVVTLDANHPLAGQDLTFDIELVRIQAAA